MVQQKSNSSQKTVVSEEERLVENLGSNQPENDEKRMMMGENSKEIVSKYDWEKIIEEILNEYKEL